MNKMQISNKTRISLVATALALILIPMMASAAYAGPSSPLATQSVVSFKVVNMHGAPQAGAKATFEINDHRYVKYTNALGMVSFSLSGYSPSAKINVDFEKGTLGSNYFGTVGQAIGKTFTIRIS